MRCPVCDHEATLRPLHKHLADTHPELVRFEERSGRRYYNVSCPQCGAGYEQAIKPRLNDPEFLVEYENEIRLVALDMLLNHMVGEHLEAAPPQDPSPAPTREVT